MKNNKNAVYGIIGAGLALALFCLMFAACPEPEVNAPAVLSFSAAPVLTIEPGNKELTVTWENSDPAADTYDLYWAEGNISGPDAIKKGTKETGVSSPVKINGLSNDVTYSVLVRANKEGYTGIDSRIANGTPLKGSPYMRLSLDQLEFGPYEETRTFLVETNADSVEVSKPSWCTINDLGNNSYSVRVSNYSGERKGAITLKNQEDQLTAELPVAQYGYAPPAFTGPNDIKISVSGATASEAQSGLGINLTYDGNLLTRYSSRWDNSGTPLTKFPVTLSYRFTGAPAMDYLAYYATEDTIGNFQELEIWTAHNGSSTLQKYGDFNFNSNSARVSFVPPLVNPTVVEFRVKSGTYNMVACAEMEFYRKPAESFNYLTVFTDSSCSRLKEGVTRETIDAIPDLFFKDLALKIFLNIYDKTGFRAQEYRAWVYPDDQASANKTWPYSLHDNPAGIYIKKDEDLLVFAGIMQGQNLSLISQDLITGGSGTRHKYPLAAGVNRIKAKADGLIYVQYYSPQGESAPKVNINFVTGQINGYFDTQKHNAGDWTRLLNAAVATEFDLVGKFAHLTFPVSDFKSDTPDGKALADAWDDMVRLEHEFMGLYKYDRVYKNRIYCHIDYTTTYGAYATAYHNTAYSVNMVKSGGILNPGKFRTTGIWGPAHEVGHVNQLRPGVAWNGMTEVTTNIYSLHVQTSFGNTSGLLANGDYSNYNLAFAYLLGKNKSHNDAAAISSNNGTVLSVQLVPFWQLKLYLCDALGKTDFYKDLFEDYRTSPNPGTAADTDGRFQLHFVRTACKIANLDLTYFFEQWGFLTPVEIKNNAGETVFKVTQAQADALKAEIAGKNYPKPAKDFTRITDANVNEYK